MNHPDIIVVDENDIAIGKSQIGEAYRNNKIVRISRVLIFNDKKQLLLQKRSHDNLAWPNLWNDSAAGHVDFGENYEEAAYRELEEEAGISGVPLTEFDYYYIEEPSEQSGTVKRFCKLYSGLFNGSAKAQVGEVDSFRWIDENELSSWITEKPQDFTPGFIEALQRYKKQTQ